MCREPHAQGLDFRLRTTRDSTNSQQHPRHLQQLRPPDLDEALITRFVQESYVKIQSTFKLVVWRKRNALPLRVIEVIS